MTFSRPGLRWTRLQDQSNLAYGQSVAIQTAGQIPPGRLVTAVRFVLMADFTNAGGAGAIQFGEVFRQMIAGITIGRRVNLTGLGATALAFMKHGRFTQFPGDIAAADGVYSKRIEWEVDYWDPSSLAPFDGCVPSEVWTDQVEVRLAQNSIFAATAPTLSNATLRTYVAHVAQPVPDAGKVADLPISMQMVDQGFNALSAVIQKAGAWIYAVAYREVANDRGRFTSANVTAVSSLIDGDPQLSNLRGEDAASMFNATRAIGSLRGTAATPVFNTPAESLDDQPLQAAGSGQGASFELLPLLWPHYGYTIGQIPQAGSGLTANITGTLGAYRVAYQLIEPHNEAALGAAARKLGFSKGTVRAKTRNGKALSSAALGRFLPAQIVE